MKKRYARGGFSLPELLVVTLLLGILAGMATGPVGNWLSASRVDNAARVVAQDLRLAAVLASRQGAPLRIEFATDGLSYRFHDRGSGQVVFERVMGAGTELPIASGTASVADLVVFPSRMTSGPLTLTLRAGRHAATVSMTSAAFVRVAKP